MIQPYKDMLRQAEADLDAANAEIGRLTKERDHEALTREGILQKRINDLLARAEKAEAKRDSYKELLQSCIKGNNTLREKTQKANTERDEARAQVAAAYEAAAQARVLMAEEGGFLTRVPLLPETKAAIRALAPADAQAALEAYGREKVRAGMKRAADLVPWGNKDGLSISAAILAEMETLK